MQNIFYKIASDMPVPKSLGKYILHHEMIMIIIVEFIEHKIDTNPLMGLSPRRESPGTDMGRYLKRARQGITKVPDP